MTDQPYWADTDVELAVDAILNLPEPCAHYAEFGADFACDECKVLAVLSALAAAGRLTPAPTRTPTRRRSSEPRRGQRRNLNEMRR